MGNKEQIVEERELSAKMIAQTFSIQDEETKVDTIAQNIVPMLGAVANAEKVLSTEVVTVDGVNEEESTGYSFARDIVRAVQSRGIPIANDAIDSALTAIAQLGRDQTALGNMGATVDGVMEVRGADLVVQLARLNFLSIINSNIPNVVGEIGDFVEDAHSSPIGGGTAYKIYEISDVVTDGKGDLATNTELNTKNIFTPVTTLAREAVQKVEGGKLTYTFDVKINKEATENYPLRRGHTEVVIAGTGINFTDINVKNKNTNFSDYEEVNDKKVTFDVKYTDGQVIITLEEDGVLPVGTSIIFKASLDSAKTSETRTYFGSDIQSNTYVAELVNMGTKINVIDDAEIKKNIGLALLPRGLRISEAKRTAEILGRIVKYITLLAGNGGNIDITDSTYSTRAEEYKAVINLISQTSKDIATETAIAGAGRLATFGGKDLITLMNLSSPSGSGNNVVATDANGFQYLGMLDNTYPCYYHPIYDEDNPMTDKDGVIQDDATKNTYFNITVCGMPIEPSRRIVLKGMPIPIQPVTKVGVDSNLVMDIPITGQQIVSINKSPKSQKLSKKLYIKA